MKSAHSSKHNKRILFLVDHKHRDLPSLSLIGYFLRQMGYQVKYIALWQEDAVIRSFNPRYLVLPKPLYKLGRLVRFKLEGRELIVVNTEGNPQDKTYKMNISLPPDLYFFWNEIQWQTDRTTLAHADTSFRLAGCPRLDFLHETISVILPSRSVLLKRYGLSPEQKTVTIATSTQDSHFSEDDLKGKERIRNRYLTGTADYRDIVNNMRALRDITQRMIEFVALNYPDLNIVVKPHPNESILFWRDLIASLPTTNIHLCVGEPINHVLRVSDLHIAHNVCTTTLEGLLAGLPTVEIHTDQSQEMYGAEHLQLATFRVKTVEELGRIIQQELYRGKQDEEQQARQNEKLQAYIGKYLYRFDGLRCYEHAREIDEFIKRSSSKSAYYGEFLAKHPEYVWPYFKAQVKRPLSKGKQFVKKMLLDTRDAATEESLGDTEVDHRGRYDNRIKRGDEEYWFEKFEQAGFRVEEFEERFLFGKGDSIV